MTDGPLKKEAFSLKERRSKRTRLIGFRTVYRTSRGYMALVPGLRDAARVQH